MLAHPSSDYLYVIGFRPEQTLAVEVPLVFNRFFVPAIYHLLKSYRVKNLSQ